MSANQVSENIQRNKNSDTVFAGQCKTKRTTNRKCSTWCQWKALTDADH